MFRLFFLALLIFALLVSLALYYLPWYVNLALAVALFFSAKYLFRWGLQRLFMIPFRMKGAVLRDATVEIHSVEPTTRPVRRVRSDEDEQDQRTGELETIQTTTAEGETAEILSPADTPEDDADESDEDNDQGPRDWYRADVTITPRSANTRFQHWEPGELLLIPHDQKVTLDSIDESESTHIEDIRLFDPQTHQWLPDDPGKYHGPMRLQFAFAVKPGSPRRLKFQYYFESFGELTLPPSRWHAGQRLSG